MVKDLAWLVEGHYIEQDFDLGLYWLFDVEERLLLLDSDPALLINAVSACKSHFLGSYFETLFSFAIEHLSSLSVVLEHFQIEGKGKTLGEVDMLVETPEGELHQFEIAIKFYLERPDLYPHDWIGPNKNDSLLKKVTRAREHQLSILHTEAGFAAIKHVAKNRVPKSTLLIFGRLYLALKNQQDIASWLDQDERGGWIRESDFTLLMTSFSHFYVLDKPHWMSFPNLNDQFIVFSAESAGHLVSDFLKDDRPKHVFLYDIESKQFNNSVFVVPDSW
ncbi:hypothetical protein MUS1_08275 [Marinomonas ushuaiensis DSM 15871]|uniref:DUF1853 domain-containing protein n=1 Tax=Marinomonas ushuaiensis DSM 15871 TaxID=1122207 RepID=X7E7X9_9GAMM|nr:hypothetical protein MUS1_08275 [Marinomonas ushuaiensis DSM 15871]